MHITLLHTNSVGEGGETGQLLQHLLDFLSAKIEIMQIICVFENFRTFSKIKLREEIYIRMFLYSSLSITPAHLSLEGERLLSYIKPKLIIIISSFTLL